MKPSFSCARIAAFGLAAGVMVLLNSCSKSSDASVDVVPRNPKEAASQLQQVFEQATPEVKQNATVASEAMRRGDYEQAVVILQVMRSRPNITLEQGIAIHNSAVTMETKLIGAVEAGDESAKRAYRLLKELKRD